jgi:hypothetical protein
VEAKKLASDIEEVFIVRFILEQQLDKNMAFSSTVLFSVQNIHVRSMSSFSSHEVQKRLHSAYPTSSDAQHVRIASPIRNHPLQHVHDIGDLPVHDHFYKKFDMCETVSQEPYTVAAERFQFSVSG